MTKLSHVRLNFKDFNQKLPLIKQNVINRNAQKYANADLVNHLYEEYRKKRYEIDMLRKRRNEHSSALKAILVMGDEEKKEKLMESHHKIGKSFKTDLQNYEKDLDNIELQLITEALKLPNKTHPDSPVGTELNNKVIRQNSEKYKGLHKKSHLEIGEQFDLFDFQNASKLTGNKFVFLKNEAAILELALINYAINKVGKKGFTPVTTPDFARAHVVEACGFQPRDEAGQIYMLDNMNECLIATSEIPMAGMHMGELVKKDSLPVKYVSFSHCFRKEAGRGESSKGLYRLHQFSKVEMFGLSEGDYQKSEDLLNEFVSIQEEIVESLGLHYRLLDMATEELGAAAYRKYDIEAWMPSKQDYGEICSASNCTGYQSKRLNISYFDQGAEKKLVHTVNATALAVPRIIMSILENYWDENTQTMRCGDQLTEKAIDSKIEQMLENITKHKEDEVTLTFFNQQQGQSGVSYFSNTSSRREPWEIWTVQFKFTDISDAQVNLQEEEEKFNTLIMDIVDKINDSCDLLPNVYEGLKCYPFQVEIKKMQSGSAQNAGSSFFGLFKKIVILILTQQKMEFDSEKLKDTVDQHGRPVLVPSVTVDAMAVKPKQDGSGHEILMIIRGGNPYKGHLAFPGGFVDYNEDPLVACVRELQEECGIEGTNPTLVTVAGKPGRDPRKHIVSIFYKVDVDPTAQVKAGDDAAHAQFYDIAEIWGKRSELAFDHGDNLKLLLEKYYPQYL
eukprot:403366713